MKSVCRLLLAVVPAAVLLSCVSSERRLEAPRSTTQMRLEDIEASVAEAPEHALHLLGAFGIAYGDSLSDADSQRAVRLRENALGTLAAKYRKAVEERSWLDAASCARSLRAVGAGVDAPSDAYYLLRRSRELLDKNDEVPAFLTAALAHRIEPLSEEDARLFLNRAVETGQRRTAAFFAKIIGKLGGKTTEAEKAFISQSSPPSEMIKGVATVWVDRGIKIDKGMGIPDRVIGSAFFIDRRGYLVTNYHVVESEVDPKYEGYSRLYIRLGDSSTPRIPAKVVGWDPLLDLALIKAEIEPAFVFGVLDEADLEPGERVLAIGSPAGLESTVTAGIVSAVGRKLLQIGSVVQIDAAVNHGNSGGPVVDMDGRLAGVVFAGIEQFEGLNFAVPVSRLADALPALYKGGRVERPWIGCSLYEGREGAEIIYVAPGTPAADQRMPEGSLVVSLGGMQAKTIRELQDTLFLRQPGELISVVTGDGKSRVLETAARPRSPWVKAYETDSRERLAAPLFGLLLASSGGGAFSPQFVVRRVLRGSVADEAGLSENDPVSVKGFAMDEDAGIAVIDLFVKKRRMGYLESTIRLPALVNTPDTL